MNILLAHSDRDFLQSYQKLLTMDGHTVAAAFDGIQALSQTEKAKPDVAILEEALPRVDFAQLLSHLEQAGVPCVALMNRRVAIRDLLRRPLPSAYLSFPFLPQDLSGLMAAILEKARSQERLLVGGVEVDVPRFRLAGTDTRLTNGEIDLLRSLSAPRKAAGKRSRTMILSLNEKLAAAGKKARIEYEIEKGYRLVNGYE